MVNSRATRAKLASKKTWQNRDPADAGVSVEGDVGDGGVGAVVGCMGDDRSPLQTPHIARLSKLMGITMTLRGK